MGDGIKRAGAEPIAVTLKLLQHRDAVERLSAA
jgi:hypothetical protein